MKTLIILLLPILSFGQIDDKTKHVYAGTFISIGSGATINYFTHKHALSVVSGVLIGCTAGVLKEVYDKNNGGTCDNWDAGATIWGSLLGGISLRVYLDCQDKRNNLEKRKLDYYN